MSKQATLFSTGGRLTTLCGLPVDDSPMSLQQAKELCDEAVKPRRYKPTLLELVRSVMSDGRYRAAFEIQREVDIRYGTYASESSISARVRELRKHVKVEDRRAAGKRHKEYRIR